MSSKANKEINAMQTALTALSGLKADEQTRALAWLAQKLGVTSATGILGAANINPPVPPGPVGTGNAGNQIPNVRNFMTQKRPKDFQERVACLAYYLTHHKNTPAFKTREITKMNSDAGQPNLSNPAVFVENSVKCQYLSSAGGGRKQITPRGEAVVEALPDREAVKQALDQHPLAGRKGKGKKKKSKAS